MYKMLRIYQLVDFLYTNLKNFSKELYFWNRSDLLRPILGLSPKIALISRELCCLRFWLRNIYGNLVTIGEILLNWFVGTLPSLINILQFNSFNKFTKWWVDWPKTITAAYQIFSCGIKRFFHMPTIILTAFQDFMQTSRLLKCKIKWKDSSIKIHQLLLSTIKNCCKKRLLKLSKEIITALKRSFRDFYSLSSTTYPNLKLTPTIYMMKLPKSAEFCKCMSKENKLLCTSHLTNILLTNRLWGIHYWLKTSKGR